MIPVEKHSSRLGERVRLVVLHTSEGARTVDALAAFLRRDGINASYHGAVDDTRYEAYVNYSRAAWALRNGNQESDNLCLCGFASWSREEWLRHTRMLDLTAAWIADRCAARGVPVRLLTPAEVAAALRDDKHPGGVCDHDRYTRGTRDGTHWDVGPNFPWDVVMARAQTLHDRISGRSLPAATTRRARRRDEDNSMELPPTTARRDHQIPTDVVGGWCGKANLLLYANTDGNKRTAKVYGIYAVAHRGNIPPLVTELLRDDEGHVFNQWWPWKGKLPDGTTSVIVNYVAPSGMVARVEYER